MMKNVVYLFWADDDDDGLHLIPRRGGEGGLEIHPHPPLEREDEVHGFFSIFSGPRFLGGSPPVRRRVDQMMLINLAIYFG